MEENILESIKSMLGSEPDYHHFDKSIIMCINSAFGVLFQLGVGPKDKQFSIVTGDETWNDFIQNDQIELVKNYIAIKTQLMFDPPSNSFLVTLLKDMEKEYEWRLNVDAETP